MSTTTPTFNDDSHRKEKTARSRAEHIGTKEKILRAARELFNEQGVEAVTVRHIAARIGISHGNLCYHFPRKEDIIMALYQGVVEGMSREIEGWRNRSGAESSPLALVLQTITVSYALQYENRFLMIDFVNIMRRIPEIRTHFRAVFLLRKEQFTRELLHLRDEGYLRDDLADADYENLALHAYQMGDFWLSEAEILFDGEESRKLTTYTALACSMLVPYLSERGRDAYARIMKSLFPDNLNKGREINKSAF